MPLQIIYQWLKSSDAFKNCLTRFVYELGKSGTAMLIKRNSFFDYENLGITSICIPVTNLFI